jgi:hypothetical protein
MSVKIEPEVINNIIDSYNSISDKQTRTYGILLGTKKGEIYHITNAIYGFIFETGKNEDGSIILNRINDTILNPLINTFANNYQNLIILGCFVTDINFFPALANIYSTIASIKNKNVLNDNSILLLVDTFYNDNEKLDYGVKTYKWRVSFHSKNKMDYFLMTCKEINYEIVQKLDTFGIINEKGSEQFKFDIGLNKLSDSDFKNVIDELEKLDEISENVKDNKSENLVFVKTQLKICSKYLELIQNYLNNIKESDIDNELLNKIMMVISMLKPIFEKEEIANLMKKEHNHNRIVSDLVNILNIQAYLTDKINKISF